MDRQIVLYWGARSKSDLYLPELPVKWAARASRLLVHPGALGPEARGRLDRPHGLRPPGGARRLSPSLAGYQVYACGAPAMTDIAKETFVAQKGLPEDEFFCDAFTYSVDPKKTVRTTEARDTESTEETQLKIFFRGFRVFRGSLGFLALPLPAIARLRRCTFPVVVIGSASTNSISRGHWKAARCAFTCSRMDSTRAPPRPHGRVRAARTPSRWRRASRRGWAPRPSWPRRDASPGSSRSPRARCGSPRS